MKKLYIYNNYHNGDVISNRALIKALLSYEVNLTVGSYKNRAYLVEDLPVNHIIWEEDECDNHPGLDLGRFCPGDCIPINGWLGLSRSNAHAWESVVEVFNEQSKKSGLDLFLSTREVPLFDFRVPFHFRVQHPAIYLENSPTRSSYCSYDFKVEELARQFPELTFYCTGIPDLPKDCSLSNVLSNALSNVRDCSQRNLVELSGISNQCDAIVGKGSGPYMCTLTEVNRYKPRAVMGYTPLHISPIWPYPNCPAEYLNTTEELILFLEKVQRTKYEEI